MDRVLISGAGIAGPTVAYWLSRYGFAVTLLERAPRLRAGGYIIDFWGAGYDVADRMGLRDLLEHDGYHVQEVRIVDADGKAVAGFDARIFGDVTGGRFVSVLRSDLSRRIYELVEGDVETMFGDTITAIVQDDSGVTVSFDRASSRRFDLVIGADGLHSAVRRLALGRNDALKYLGYYTAAFAVRDYPHRDEDVYTSYSIPGRQVARYALRDGQSAFFFMVARDVPLEIPPGDVDAQRSVLAGQFAGAGWECDEILDAMNRSDELYFDSVAQVRIPEWSRGRVALVGDAAYCPSLLAGEGAGLAMAGAYVLAHALHRSPGDYARAFHEYERTLRPLIDKKQRSAERFARWFAPRTRAGVWLRNAVTRSMRVPFIASRVARGTLGDTLRLPV